MTWKVTTSHPGARHANLHVPFLELRRHDCLGELLCLATGVKRRQGPFPLSTEAIGKCCPCKVPSDGRLRSYMSAGGPNGACTAVQTLHVFGIAAILLQNSLGGAVGRASGAEGPQFTIDAVAVQLAAPLWPRNKPSRKSATVSLVDRQTSSALCQPLTARRHVCLPPKTLARNDTVQSQGRPSPPKSPEAAFLVGSCRRIKNICSRPVCPVISVCRASCQL